MITPCSFCTAECCKNHYITVTAFDIIRISEKTGRKAEDFAALYPLRLIKFDNETVLETYDGKYPEEYLLCLKCHPCIFLKRNKCTIHDFAPYVCGTYPKQVNGKFNFRLCPAPSSVLFRMSGIKVPEKFREELDAYKEMVAEWNKKKGKKKNCLSFLIKKACQSEHQSL